MKDHVNSHTWWSAHRKFVLLGIVLAAILMLAGCHSSVEGETVELSPTMEAADAVVPDPTATPEPTVEPTPEPIISDLTEEDLSIVAELHDIYLVQQPEPMDLSIQEDGQDPLGILSAVSVLDDSAIPEVGFDAADVDVTTAGDYTVTFYVTVDLEAYETALDDSVEKTITTMTVTEDSNVRSGPGTGYGVIGSYSEGTVVIVTGQEDGWYSVYYNGLIGYISGAYLAGMEHAEETVRYFDAGDDTESVTEIAVITKTVHVVTEDELAAAVSAGLVVQVSDILAVASATGT